MLNQPISHGHDQALAAGAHACITRKGPCSCTGTSAVPDRNARSSNLGPNAPWKHTETTEISWESMGEKTESIDFKFYFMLNHVEVADGT